MRFIVSTLAIGIVLTACGGSPSSNNSSPGTQGPTTQSSLVEPDGLTNGIDSALHLETPDAELCVEFSANDLTKLQESGLGLVVTKQLLI